MIRKLTLPFFTLIFIIMTTNISYADWPDVDDDCYSLGGIVLAESTLDDVMAIYGKPDYYGQMGFNKRWIQ